MTARVVVEIKFDKLPELEGLLLQRATDAVVKAAYDIEGHAKAAVPVDTGNLKSSIQTTQEGPVSASVGPRSVDYAGYVEYGTYKMGAQPYMRPAAERVAPAFISAMEQIAKI